MYISICEAWNGISAIYDQFILLLCIAIFLNFSALLFFILNEIIKYGDHSEANCRAAAH